MTRLVLEAGSGEDARWDLLDRLGSTIAQSTGGRIDQLASYSDFGEQSFATSGWDSETGFGGEQANPELGATNYYARTYDPSTGTWLSQDVWRGLLAQPQGLNRYGFVENNPATFLDDSGFCSYKSRESGCRSAIGGKTPKPSPGGRRSTGSLSSAVGHGQPSSAVTRVSSRGAPAVAAGMSASAPTPAGASASFIPMRHDRPSATTSSSHCDLARVVAGTAAELLCTLVALDGVYSYSRDWDLGASSGVSAEEAMTLFQSNPEQEFPFPVSGCSSLATGEVCTLHALELELVFGTPFGPGAWYPGAQGTVEVTSTPTSVLFTVVGDGYFDNAGSTIEFTITERHGHLFLHQDAVGITGDPLLEYMLESNDVSWFPWVNQRDALIGLLDDHR